MPFIFLGILVILFSSVLFFPLCLATSTEEKWNDFYKYLQETDNSTAANLPEDVLFSILQKAKLITGMVMLVGIIMLTCGIALII